jgi:hypothetical protein
VYAQPPSFDPSNCSLLFGSRPRPSKAQLSPCRKKTEREQEDSIFSPPWLSSEVIALHVEPTEHSELLQMEWEHYVEQPFRTAGKEPPKLHVLPSPYRFIIIPIVQFFSTFRKGNPRAASSWSYPSLWKTNGMNISSTISVDGFWNGCCSPAAMNASLR